jgi:hypothetical protein
VNMFFQCVNIKISYRSAISGRCQLQQHH